jgi:prepilin-type processing-associated H-X9-DG protein
MRFFDGENVVLTRDWLTKVTNDIMDNWPLLSYCLMCTLPGNVPLDTTPLGFTRGLNKNGLWDAKVGLYGSKGGYVVYCDGHVAWFDGSKAAKFIKWDKSGYTSDIRQAVPTGVIISCAADDDSGIKAPYKNNETTPAFIHTVGTGGSL